MAVKNKKSAIKNPKEVELTNRVKQENITLEQEVTKKKSLNEEFNVIVRSIISIVLFILGFNLSNSTFFAENPLYGINYLAEVLISITSAAAGFFLVPRLLLQLREWFEDLIVKTVTDIVSYFWEQQTNRINERKRDKQKQKADQEKEKLLDQLKNSVVLDTSVLIDGRILDIVKTGFFDKNLIVPTAVLNELHLISDNKDKLKRERGRRGLDFVKKLKSVATVHSPKTESSEKDVDNKLLDFAKRHKLPLMTQDFNLNKVAQASGVTVLNLNNLVEAVKMTVLPGDELEVEISHEGKAKKQGVGYMADGTMVVVEDARDRVGETLVVKVNKVIQKPAGKIVFSRLR
ncbi:MAG: TRAM domain-containing protein [Paludibacteraceae bacterium]|nr:TRAM domain-containing protein [Paludibacteraceae bacterium]